MSNILRKSIIISSGLVLFMIITGFIMNIYWICGDSLLFSKVGRGGSINYNGKKAEFIQKLKSTFIVIPKTIIKTREFHPNKSDIPVINLHIKLARIERLNSNLPRSGMIYENGNLEYNGRIYPVKVKYRGDLWYHWGSIQKSWRIKMKQGDSFHNMNVFNIINPKSKAIIDIPFAFNLANEIGVLSPQSFTVNFMLNNKFQGVMIATEQIDKNWMINAGLDKGEIYYGEGMYADAYSYYDDPSRSILWTNPEGWQKVALPNQDRNNKDKLVEILKFITNADNNIFNKYVWKHFNREMFLRYHALAILGLGYGDDNHNWKIYINSKSGQVFPIVWDIGIVDAYRIPNMEFAHDFLSGRMFADKQYFLDLAKYIYEISEKEGLRLEDTVDLSKKNAMRIKYGVYRDKFKDYPTTYNVPYTNKDWEQAVEEKSSVLKIWRDSALKSISETKVSAAIKPAETSIQNNKKNGLRLDVTVSSFSGVKLDTITLTSPEQNRTASKFILLRANNLTKVYTFQNGTANISDELIPKRKNVWTSKDDVKNVIEKGASRALYDQCGTIPTTFSYYLTSENTGQIDLSNIKVRIKAVNIVTGKTVTLDALQQWKRIGSKKLI